MRCARRWVFASAMLLSTAQPCVAEARGVVVELIERGSVGERIGLRIGDRLVAWIEKVRHARRHHREGTVRLSFRRRTFEYEIAPRAGVSIRVERDARSLVAGGTSRSLGRQHGAHVLGSSEAAYRQGADLARAGKIDDAVVQWRQLSGALARSEPVPACWLLWRIGSLLDSADRMDAADQTFQEALALARPLAQPAIDAQLQYSRATIYLSRDRQSDSMQTLLKESADGWEGVSGRGLAWAWVYARYARTLERPGADSPSSRALREVLAVQLRLAGAGYPTAQTYNTLALNLLRAGQFGAAQELFQKARAIHARYSPVAGDHASVLNNIAMIAMRRGNLVEAERLLDQADRIDRNNSSRTFPPRPDSSMALQNHGIIAWSEATFPVRKTCTSERLRSRCRRYPMVPAPAASCTTLASSRRLAATSRRPTRGSAAHLRFRKGAIHARIARARLCSREPTRLAAKVRRLGGSRGCRSSSRRNSLASGTGHMVLTSALMGLGEIQFDQRRFPEARASFEQALSVPATAAPSLVRFKLLHLLARVERAEHNYVRAETHIREAVAIRTAISPNSGALAAALHTLGLILRDQRRPAESLSYLKQAVDVVERQRARLGASDDAAATFSGVVAAIYQDCIDSLVEEGFEEDAFAMLERSRARAFLQRLAERDLMFGRDIPEALRTQRVYAESDLHRAQQRLADATSSADKTAVRRLQAEVTQLQAQLRAVEQLVKQRSPSLAALQYPTPLTLGAARRTLPSGTALLSYSVGAERLLLFVVQPPGESGANGSGLTVFKLDVTREQLQKDVAGFLTVLKTRPGADPAKALAGVTARASVIYRQLIGPAEQLISMASRLLIVADGPLHSVPFGALVRDSSDANGYLMTWKPITTVASVTVLAELRRRTLSRGATPSSLAVATFGDPRYPMSLALGAQSRGEMGVKGVDQDGLAGADSVADDSEVVDAVRAGFKLERLPGTREEAQAIAQLYRPQSVAYIGADATEERVKQLPRNTRIVHYALHAVINNRLPLNSALALTIPDRGSLQKENGLLHAWEILDQVRLDADLVTLSACETAVGQEAGGEGLLSLTRAFHHAGARSVLASLWRVDDRATSGLMKRFYTSLRSGASKDEALREAQRAMANDREWAHPFYWAAFQLSGARD